MKMLPLLSLASLLAAGSAFAASTPTATPAPAATPAATHAVKHNTRMHCEKEAHAKKLSGDEEKNFVKDCRAGKSG